MKKILLTLILLLLLMPCVLLALLASNSGSRWLLQAVLPEQIAFAKMEGRLLDRLTLTGLRFANDQETIAAERLVFAWQPAGLLRGNLSIDELAIHSLNIESAETANEPESPPLELKIELPVPMQLSLSDLSITDIDIKQNGQTQHLEELQLTAYTEADRVHILSLKVDSEALTISAQGSIGFGSQPPLDLSADWQVTTKDYGLWQGSSTITGTVQQPVFENRLSSPFAMTVNGRLDDVMTDIKIQAAGDWQNLHWPLDGNTPEIASKQGRFELTGSLKEYRLTLSGDLNRQDLPETRLQFNGQGNTGELNIETLSLDSSAGSFRIGGRVSWQDEPSFDLHSTGANFDPALFVPELAGNLSLDTHIKGRLHESLLHLTADIRQLSGRLREYPINAGGKLVLEGEKVQIDRFELVSGKNRFAVDGALGREQAALNFDIAAPVLKSLWPELDGSLTGKGRLQGALPTPSVSMQLNGKHLRYREHAVDKLALQMDYHADSSAASTLALSGAGLQSGGIRLDRLNIDGSGNPAQHRLSAELNSEYGEMAMALTGRLKNSVWIGDIEKLALNTRKFGVWRLGKRPSVRIAQKTSGFEADLSKLCLTQQDTQLCLQGRYPANGDFAATASAGRLPVSLLAPYLPETLKMEGFIDADADLNNRQGKLNGTYRINLGKITATLQSGSTASDFDFGASSLSGTINSDIVSADLNLALAAKDYLRANLRLNHQTQSLSGRITASIAELTPFYPFVPQLTKLNGNLIADMALSGSVDKPLLNGHIDFEQGSADVDDLGLHVHGIEFHALAAGIGPVRLNGSLQSGQGIIKLNGFADLPNNGELKLSGNRFEAAKLPEAQLEVSPDLLIDFTDRHAKAAGKLVFDKAVLQLQDLPQNAVTVSQDEIIVGEEKPPEKSAAPSFAVDTDIDVELGKQAGFAGLGLKTDLSGKLHITQAGAKTAMYGTIVMKKASYKSYGQDLDVRKGRFVFNGPADKPWMDVEAVRVSKSKKVTAILKLSGPLNKPQTRISTEPALPESEALAYLITGGPLSQVSKSEGNILAGAALSYGSGQLSWIADKLGVDEFEVKQGKTLQDTLATIGQYLTPDFYAGAKVSLFTKQVVLVLKHKLTDHINVETQTGTSQRIKLNYEFDTD